jgi:UDP-GlcNAc:undecaprenyl-phosphate GlcNAc-1-phosphate transferase
MIEMKFAIAAGLAFLIVFTMVPLVIALCNRWKIHDQPGPLKIHAKPLPRLGGVAITLGMLGAVWFSARGTGADIAAVIACIVAVAAIGLVDDIRGVSRYARLGVHLAAGVFLGLAGFGIALTNVSALNVLLTAAVVAAFINAFNFLDGSDGVASSVAAIIAIGYIVSARADFSNLSAAIGWGLLGSSACFLGFNWPPARIFLGDSGSTVIGLLVALLALEHWRTAPTYTNPAADLFPLVVAAVPLTDAVFAILRRFQSGTSVTRGDRRHFYDGLLKKGYSPRGVAIAAGAATAGCVCVGWAALRCSTTTACGLIALLFAALAITGVWLGSIQIRSGRPPETATVSTGSSSIAR